ncbi:hypothetical protein A2482_04015 [Candidatus Falkowbacteria bacterium RIFOXYC2_FULL_48_21]|uniref:SHSP domain-containing protein n=1 Tax=Candidatus Falkowbacteria bacterium RIFOXYC2_FULL_48_21 TaxID=1798005 RepID=A0A1F5TH43_9BACT|nr:MAG: hypothetical protein A2482_04015 [Candidatus Falkowbacteria bacterium RIFOXYC2_FULL_48_21]
MNDDANFNWYKHLEELEEHYRPDRFFQGQETLPTNESNVRDQFFASALTEEADLPEEAKLSIDIYQDEKNLYVMAPIAGVKPDTLEITLDKDVLTIRGQRGQEFSETNRNFVYQECYWGRFSRSIVLPSPVDGKNVEASLKDSVLKIKLPKTEEEKKVSIKIKNIE